MAQTAYAFDDQIIATSDEAVRLKNRFLSRSEIRADEINDLDLSAEKFWRVSDDNLMDVIGIDVRKGVVRRASPPTDRDVRTRPSSTGKVVEWEGVVDSVSGNDFSCRMKVVKGSNVEFEEFSRFSFDRVDPGDRDLVQPGALFRLVVGVQAYSGTRQHVSRLIFRRLPAWREDDIKSAQADLESVLNRISWADEVTSAT